MSRALHLCIAGPLLALLPACVTTEEYNRARASNGALQREIDDLKRYQKELGDSNKSLSAENAELKARAVDAAWVDKEKKRLEELAKQFESGGPLSSSGVKVIGTPEGLAFQLQGEILFASGSADISESGKETLRKLIPTLQKEGKRVRVDGHTDIDPIKTSQWRTNLRLSAERSLTVTEFLIHSGFPADRIGVGGFGEHRPAVPGTSDDAKKQNRRVEILMLNAN